MKVNTREMAMIGLGAALMGVFSQLALPIPPVPLTLQVFGAILLSVILGTKLGVLSMIVFMLVGAVGLPAFSNFRGGLSVLVGPTGGYIIGFIALAWCVGIGMQQKKKWLLFVMAYLGMGLEYAIGTVQLKWVASYSWPEAMAAGVYPFILKDLILTAVAIVVGMQLRKHLAPFLKGRQVVQR